jgi:hypothetical protein
VDHLLKVLLRNRSTGLFAGWTTYVALYLNVGTQRPIQRRNLSFYRRITGYCVHGLVAMDNQPTPNPNNTKRRRKKKNRKNRNNRPVALQQNDASAESLHEEHTSESSESAEITSQIKLTDGLISEPSATTLAPNTAQTLVHTQAGVAVTTSSFLPEPFPPPSPPPSPPTKPRRRSTFAPSPSASSYPSLSPLSFSSQASLPVEVIIKMIQFFHPIELSGLAATCISFYLAVRHVVSERKLSEKILPTSFVNVIYLVKNAEFFPLKNFLLRFFNHPWLSMPIRNWELKQFYQICKLNPIHVRAEARDIFFFGDDKGKGPTENKKNSKTNFSSAFLLIFIFLREFTRKSMKILWTFFSVGFSRRTHLFSKNTCLAIWYLSWKWEVNQKPKSEKFSFFLKI